MGYTGWSSGLVNGCIVARLQNSNKMLCMNFNNQNGLNSVYEKNIIRFLYSAYLTPYSTK